MGRSRVEYHRRQHSPVSDPGRGEQEGCQRVAQNHFHPGQENYSEQVVRLDSVTRCHFALFPWIGEAKDDE